jgi:ribosomal protein S18 acetylase RimI-like enzyme
MQDSEYRHYSTSETRQLFETLVAVYMEVYAHEQGEFFDESRICRQLESHMKIEGFEVVGAHLDGRIVGYIYGFPLPADTSWWRGLLTPVARELLEETGDRTFAISELVVRPAWQGRGIGRALHDDILRSRGESRATLLVEQDNEIAKTAYYKWGWRHFGQLQPHWPGAPVLDALMLQLPLKPRS